MMGTVDQDGEVEAGKGMKRWHRARKQRHSITVSKGHRASPGSLDPDVPSVQCAVTGQCLPPVSLS